MPRQRLFTATLKSQFCDLVRSSHSLAEAADAIGITLRTVQRCRRDDAEFDQAVRTALLAPPDPLKLMESAARTHWRAAAWLLERTQPEKYARKPSNMASAARVHDALYAVLEAALAATEPNRRSEVYEHVHKTLREAFNCCFPNHSAQAQSTAPKPTPTPLTDRERFLEEITPRTPSAPRSHAPCGNAPPDAPRREPTTPTPPPALAPGSSNRGPAPPKSAPPANEELNIQQALNNWDNAQLQQLTTPQHIRDMLDLLMSPKMKQATRQEQRRSA